MKLNKYMKVIKIVMVQVLGLVEGERTFNNLTCMLSKLRNQLTTHFYLCVQMFIQLFLNAINFLYDVAIATWKEMCIKC